MAWVLLLLIIGAALFVAMKTRVGGDGATGPNRAAPRAGHDYFQAGPAGPSSSPSPPTTARQATRDSVVVREGAKPPPSEPARWSSDGREIPFAHPGLAGPLFNYGGTSVRRGSEHTGPFAVIDFETTGLSAKRDRIVEVAIARVDSTGHIEDEFATLINPEGRDVGPTFIHGITNEHVRRAPTFGEIAPELLSRLSGTVVVAHNATFEEAFLAAELARAGLSVSPVPALCSLWLGRQTFNTPNHKLGTIARAAGVPLVDKHAALGDVRAVSALLPQMTGKLRSPILYPVAPMSWPPSHGPVTSLITRAVALRKGTDGWMHSLLARLPSHGLAPNDAAAEAYLDALSEVLADGRITGDEAALLAGLAGSAGMGRDQVAELNGRFLDQLKLAALEDDILTTTEVRQLSAAAKALNLPGYIGELAPTSSSPITATPIESAIDGRGLTAREGRQERGEQALAMQRAGASRAAIAAALGVSEDTIKSALRDAKFYENPQSDPSRLALAIEARTARTSGVTKDRFQAERGLTAGKATEAWRDAGTLSEKN